MSGEARLNASTLLDAQLEAGRGDKPALLCVDRAITYRELAGLVGSVAAYLSELGVEPEKPPYHPGGRDDLPRIAFVADPDGYRIELIEGAGFTTPQDRAGG